MLNENTKHIQSKMYANGCIEKRFYIIWLLHPSKKNFTLIYFQENYKDGVFTRVLAHVDKFYTLFELGSINNSRIACGRVLQFLFFENGQLTMDWSCGIHIDTIAFIASQHHWTSYNQKVLVSKEFKTSPSLLLSQKRLQISSCAHIGYLKSAND